MSERKTQVTVTKIFKFCYAHHLENYQGKCANNHGHNSTVEIEVAQHPEQYPSMVMDFRELKSKGESILAGLDHQELNALLPSEYLPPTAENICRYLMNTLREAYRLDVIRVRVYEADDSFAEIRFI